MEVKNENRENNTLKIEITIDSETFEKGLNKAYQKAKGKIALPGFRKGKVPRKVIETYYGADVFYEDAVNEVFPEAYDTLIIGRGWKAVGQPSVTDIKFNEDKTVDLTVESALYPEITLGDYKGIEVSKAEPAVSDEEIEKELDRRANDAARISTVDRPAQEGDTAVIDFEGFVNGVAFEGGKGENHELKLGSHSFIPGFEEQVIGMAAGEERDINVTFPEEYTEELAGRPAVFKVLVHEVKETAVPAKDDELAKDISEFDTLDELRADIRATMLKEKEEGIQKAFENAALEKVAANMTCEIPDCMIDEEVEKEMQEFDYRLRSQGMSLEQYAQMLGGDLSGFKSSIRPGAESKLRISLMLNAVVDAENIEVTDEEVEAKYAEYAEQYGMDVEKIKSMLKADDMKSDIAVEKAAKLVADSAIATEAKEVSETAPEEDN